MTTGTPEWFDRAGGEPVEIRHADPAWAALAARWAAAIREAMGRPDVGVEHIGSTAVPGLPAKPVIDLQVSVPDLDDEAVYRPALESLGLILRQQEPDHRFFRPPAGTPRVVHVHVCARGSRWEEDHLRFRDALRRRPELAEQYACLKRRLAHEFAHDRGAYNAGKSAFIAAALGAERARSTGSLGDGAGRACAAVGTVARMTNDRRPRILAAQSEDFPRWYQDVLDKAELADNGPVRGTMVIRPYAYSLWERMQAEVDRRIKATGAENVYLPLFIPQSYLEREAEHVEGFSPELAVVTHAGGKELTEPVVVRPTSETLFGELLAKWIQSHRDLPMLLNQWSNVVRWELRPRLFLRTTEFLWQEGHTAHATQEDAAAYARRIHLDVYRDFLEGQLAIPVLVGAKTRRERFAGATDTMTCEAMMGDGKALQMATSHELGQNFAKAFDIGYTDAAGQRQTCWTTSWGASTRMVGGLIMAHGDDAGLRLPPNVAPIQVVVIAVKDDARTLAAATAMVEDLAGAGIRARLDARTSQGFGRRSTEWELKGVPIRIEVGPRDLDAGQVTIARRDRAEKTSAPVAEVVAATQPVLASMQSELFMRARARLAERTTDTTTVDDAIAAAATGFARIPWQLLGEEGEEMLNSRAITVRCLQTADGMLPAGPGDELFAIVGRSY